MNVEDDVTGFVSDDCIGVVAIVQELTGCHCVVGALALGGRVGVAWLSDPLPDVEESVTLEAARGDSARRMNLAMEDAMVWH